MGALPPDPLAWLYPRPLLAGGSSPDHPPLRNPGYATAEYNNCINGTKHFSSAKSAPESYCRFFLI